MKNSTKCSKYPANRVITFTCVFCMKVYVNITPKIMWCHLCFHSPLGLGKVPWFKASKVQNIK